MELAQEKELKKVIGDRASTISISELLDGVGFGVERGRSSNRLSDDIYTSVSPSLRLFYSYSHKDEHLRNQLETHLKLLNRNAVITSWYDRQIGAGHEWTNKISENLEKRQLILLLVSADFIASDYCHDIEMKRASNDIRWEKLGLFR